MIGAQTLLSPIMAIETTTTMRTTTSHKIEMTTTEKEKETTEKVMEDRKKVEVVDKGAESTVVHTTTESVSAAVNEVKVKESQEIQGTHAKVLRMTLGKEYETEKTNLVCKITVNAERMMKDLFLMISLILNMYLVFAYPFLYFMGRKWFEKKLREKDRQEQSENRGREIIPDFNLGLSLGGENNRENFGRENAKSKRSWFRLVRRN